MSQYMLLIYSSDESTADWTDDERQNDMKRWFDYTNELQEAGVLVAGEPLHGVETAKSVRNRDGGSVTSDGPFAETKEVLGGFYIVDVDSEDAAIAWAARCPGADYGTIEVRQVMDMSGMA